MITNSFTREKKQWMLIVIVHHCAINILEICSGLIHRNKLQYEKGARNCY